LRAKVNRLYDLIAVRGEDDPRTVDTLEAETIGEGDGMVAAGDN
jgi:hypothetical protein